MIENSGGLTLGRGSGGILLMNQQKWPQAAADLHLCLLVSQVNSLTPTALALLVFGLASYQLSAFATTPVIPSFTLGMGIKLVRGLHSLHTETWPGLEGAYLCSQGRLSLEPDSWGLVSVPPVTRCSQPNLSDVWLLPKERMMGGKRVLEDCLLEKVPSGKPHCWRSLIDSEIPLGLHY